MSRTRWRRVAAAAVALATVATVGSACSDSDDGSPGSASVSADSVTDSTSVVTSTLESVDGAALLQTAVDGLVDSPYHFLTIVSAGGSVALQAEGDRVGEGSRFVVIRDDASVEYVVTADGTWVKPDGEEWAQSDIVATTANPVPALAATTTVTIEPTEPASDGSTLTLLATVPDVALGYEGDGSTDVTVTLLDGAIDQVRYDTTVQGLNASLLTRIGPVTDDTPVVAPI